MPITTTRAYVSTGLVLLTTAGTFAETAAAPRPINPEFTIEDCGAPIRVLRLIASTVYRHPDTGKLHLLLEYGNNNGYGIGEQEWEDTAHRFVDVELESGQMRRATGDKPGGLTTKHFFHPNGKLYLFEGTLDELWQRYCADFGDRDRPGTVK